MTGVLEDFVHIALLRDMGSSLKTIQLLNSSFYLHYLLMELAIFGPESGIKKLTYDIKSVYCTTRL